MNGSLGDLADGLPMQSEFEADVVLHSTDKGQGVVEASLADDVTRTAYFDDGDVSLDRGGLRCPGPIRRVVNWLSVVIPYGGLVSNCFSLCSCTLGGGILSMPSSFRTSGIGMALIYLVIVTAQTVYTMTLLGKVIQKTGTSTFEDTALLLFGRGWDYFVGFILWLCCFGAAVAYVSALSGLIYPIFEHAPNTPAYLRTKSGLRLISSMIWLVFMVPVVIPKHINSIRYVSAIGVSFVFYFVVCIIVHSATSGLKQGMRGEMAYFTTGNQAIYGLSIFVFAYLVQSIGPQVFIEMRPRPSVKRFTLASAISMTLCMVLYVLTGIFGYFDFADATEDNILYNYDPVHQPYMMVSYCGLLIKIICAHAVNFIAIRNFVYHCMRWELEKVPYWRHTIAVIAIDFVTLICGLFIPSINTAFGLAGSLAGGFVGFIFPALFWMYCGDWSIHTVGWLHFLATYFLFVVGVIAVVFGTIATVYSSFIDT